MDAESSGSPTPPQPPPDGRGPFTWTAAQRRALLTILSLLCIGLGVRYACTPTYVSDPQPERPSRYDELADRIDPNTASWEVLSVLPSLGEKRAKAIVEYREWRRAQRPDEPPFRTAEDLTIVRGIGFATRPAER